MGRKLRIAAAVLLASLSLAACAREPQGTSGTAVEDGAAAIENAMTPNPTNSVSPSKPGDDLREGTSQNTVATPADFPQEYNYGTGRIRDYSRGAMLAKMPEPKANETVLNTPADPARIQVLYLWEEGNVPARTKFTPDMTGYFDSWDFRPYVTAIPVPEGVTPKGAVVLMAGGAYQFRGNYTDSLPTAAALREEGFQTFIVDYRLSPYTQEEGALDVARAVRFVRKNADTYGIDPDAIAVMGFSAGGIQAGEFLMHYDEDVTGTALDSGYITDALDAVPAHASAAGMIYSFYGRLSVGNMDPDWLAEGDLPPTYYVYGTEDPFYRQFQQQYDVISGMGIPMGRIVLDGWPHGFGSDGGWVQDYAQWLQVVFTGDEAAAVTQGQKTYREFTLDNVLHSETDGDIHYNVYIPESYDGSRPYALYVTLPGYEGLHFQGVGRNLESEAFGFEAQKYNPEMIVLAPQLSDWGETSANQTIALVEYFLRAYNIDTSRVYANGYSGGGETMSIVMGKRPDLFTAYLQVSSQWDGAYEPVVNQRVPVYFAIGKNDEYYGSQPTQKAYDTLYELYQKEGLTKAEIEKLLVLDIKERDYFTRRGMTNEHGGGGLFAYDETIMGWLFSQERER